MEVRMILGKMVWFCWLKHIHTHNRLMALCPGLPGWAGTRRNIHPLIPILIT